MSPFVKHVPAFTNSISLADFCHKYQMNFKIIDEKNPAHPCQTGQRMGFDASIRRLSIVTRVQALAQVSGAQMTLFLPGYRKPGPEFGLPEVMVADAYD